MELFYHGVWDLYLLEKYQSDIRNQLILQIVHESTDLLTVLFILLVINISSACQPPAELDGIIDIVND